MKILFENFKLILLPLFFSIVFFSFDAPAQRRKPGVSKETQMNRLANQALKEIEGGQFEKAVKTIERCFALKPVFNAAFKCHLARATAYYALEKYEEAIPDFTAANDILPDKEIRYRRGLSYFQLKKYEEANQDFFRVMISVDKDQIAEKFPDLQNYRGATYTALGKYDDAISVYNDAIKTNSLPADSYFGRAIAFELKGDFEKAEKDLQRFLELSPDSKELADETLERIKLRKNAETNDAKPSGDSANNKETFSTETDDVSALTVFADRYFNTGEYEKAAETYSKIIRLQPNDAKFYYKRGTSYGNLNKVELALADYTKTIELDPGYASAYLSRGATLQDTGKYDDAIRDLNKSMELEPQNDFNYVFRAKAYCKTGKKELAIADEKTAQKLGGFITEPCL